MVIILGIDPGIAITGYGVLQIEKDGSLKLLSYGAIRTKKNTPKPKRLSFIYGKLKGLVEKYEPNALAVELLFFNKNTQTAVTVGEARGVVLLLAGQMNIPVFEYTPLQVKETLTGYGRSSKQDLREIVQVELNMDSPPRPIDASDALAICLCHHFMENLEDI